MTPKTINIAIAECCGWQKVHETTYDGDSLLLGLHQKSNPAWGYVKVPNYHGDLNACVEMESTLEDHLMLYVEQLDEITYNASPHAISFEEYSVVHHLKWVGGRFATAPQRCETFLKTLNLWIN